MTNPPINFQKERELGDIITDTFKFLRENYKQLSKIIFKVCGPVFLILIFALGYYSYLGLDSFSNPILTSGELFDTDMFIFSFFILAFSVLAFYILLYTSVLHFIRSYVENNGEVSESQIYSGIKSDFGGMLGLLILTTIITGVGLVLCILPGIYLWVPMSIAPAILVFSRQSVLDSIGHTFTLIKDNWWTTFLCLLVMVILIYIIGLIFQLPVIFYYFFKALTASEEISMVDPTSLVDWFSIVINVISTLAQYILTTVLIVATAFIYYNLDERLNHTGSYKTISNLGSSDSE